MIFNNSIDMLSTVELIKIYIDEFNASKVRRLMIKGQNYYQVENDILNRTMIRYEDDRAIVDETKTNNKLAHGFMHTLIEDKVNYLLTKTYTLACEDDNYLKTVEMTLGKRFQKKLNQLGIETSNKGIAWLHPYIDDKGIFKVMKIPSEQCIPLWLDNDHEELQAFIRYYEVEVYEGREKKIITKIEYWTPDSVTYYVMQDGEVIFDAEKYINDEDDYDGHFKVGEVPSSWGKVPFVPFKNNDFELPDLQFIKSLIDNYDTSRSDVANLLEDIRNIIYKLKGYGGESLSTFMRELAYYRAVKLDEEGDVDTIEPNINIEAAEKHYEALKKDIFDFGQGVDKNSEKLGNSPSGIALKFIYSGLDLKCNSLEESFKWSFEQLIYFVNMYHGIVSLPVSDKEISIIFNRDIQINETESITNCMNSMGIISLETILANHPYVVNTEEELKRIKNEDEPEDDIFHAQSEGDE